MAKTGDTEMILVNVPPTIDDVEYLGSASVDVGTVVSFKVIASDANGLDDVTVSAMVLAQGLSLDDEEHRAWENLTLTRTTESPVGTAEYIFSVTLEKYAAPVPWDFGVKVSDGEFQDFRRLNSAFTVNTYTSSTIVDPNVILDGLKPGQLITACDTKSVSYTSNTKFDAVACGAPLQQVGGSKVIGPNYIYLTPADPAYGSCSDLGLALPEGGAAGYVYSGASQFEDAVGGYSMGCPLDLKFGGCGVAALPVGLPAGTYKGAWCYTLYSA